MREAALGKQHPAVAASLNNLAFLLKTMGRYADAQGMYQRCIAIKEQAMGPTHPQVYLAPLCELQKGTGSYSKHRNCRADYNFRPSFSVTAPGTCRRIMMVRFLQTHAQPALHFSIPVCEEKVNLHMSQVPGYVVLQVALSLANLAALLQAQNKIPAAEALLKRALSIREDALGPDHPLVGSSQEVHIPSTRETVHIHTKPPQAPFHCGQCFLN